MFKELRRKDMQVEDALVEELLVQGEYGVISTIGEDGYPYGVPMSYVYEDGKIYFHCGREGHKIDNFSYSDKVSFSLVYETEVVAENLDHHYKSVIVFGRLVELEGEEKIRGLRSLVRKYAGAYEGVGDLSIAQEKDITRVFRIDIEHREGKFRWGNQKA